MTVILEKLSYHITRLPDVFVQLSVEVKYPSNWNDHQSWKCVLTACRASGYLVFHHKEFFQGFLSDSLKRCYKLSVCWWKLSWNIIMKCYFHSLYSS